MVYYAPRENQVYLEHLAQIRSADQPCHLVSAAGGLAFLQAIASHTASLTLVDGSKDVVNYAKLIIALLKVSRHARQFLSFLSGREVEWAGGDLLQFGKPVSHRSYLDGVMDPDEMRIFGQTLARVETDSVSGMSRMGNDLIKYHGHDLTNSVYCWQFGRGSFSSPETFLSLRDCLARLPIEFRIEDMSRVNYAPFTANSNLPIYVLVSNTDNRAHNRQDLILKRIVSTARGAARYFSWTRDLWLFPNNQNHFDAVTKIRPWTAGRRVHEIKTFNGNHFSLLELGAEEHFLIENLSRIGKIEWGDVLLYHISLSPDLAAAKKKAAIKRLLLSVTPDFRRIIIFDFLTPSSPADYLICAEEIEFQLSYHLICLEWTGGETGFSRSAIMVWELRGQVNGFIADSP